MSRIRSISLSTFDSRFLRGAESFLALVFFAVRVWSRSVKYTRNYHAGITRPLHKLVTKKRDIRSCCVTFSSAKNKCHAGVRSLLGQSRPSEIADTGPVSSSHRSQASHTSFSWPCHPMERPYAKFSKNVTMSRKCHADKVRDLFGKIPSKRLSEWSRRMDCCNKIACSFRKLFRYGLSNSSHDFWRTKIVTQMSRREGW